MKKVATLDKFEDADEINSLMREVTIKAISMYQDLLLEVIGQIPNFDYVKMTIIRQVDPFIEYVYYDGFHIGNITHRSGFNDTDFIENKISFLVEFIPLKKP